MPVESDEASDSPSRGPRWVSLLQSRVPNRVVLSIVVAWSLVLVLYGFAAGVRHDYRLYLLQWKRVLTGDDPWAGNNAYGPVHNLLAYALPLGWWGPKIVVIVAFCAVGVLLVAMLLRTRPRVVQLVAYGLMIPANFLVVGIVGAYGLNDALVAAFIGVAVWARFRNKGWLVGVMLGLAVLLKYYPALMVPFFCLDRRTVDWRPFAWAVGTTVVGFAASIAAWGTGFIKALAFGGDREAAILSLLASLRNHPELGGDSAVMDFLVDANAVFVVAAVAVTLVYAYRVRLTWVESATIGTFVLLLVYKVGHQQFWVPWLVLLVALLIADTRRSRALAYSSLPIATALSAFQLGYQLLDGYFVHGVQIRANAGFVFTLGAVVTLAAYAALIHDMPEPEAPSVNRVGEPAEA